VGSVVMVNGVRLKVPIHAEICGDLIYDATPTPSNVSNGEPGRCSPPETLGCNIGRYFIYVFIYLFIEQIHA
jgi:hypothetical protein